MSLELLYVGGFLLGLLIVVGLGRAPIPVRALSASYKDENCDEDTSCRLLAEPSYFVLTAVAPGMFVGLIVALAWHGHEGGSSRKPTQG